LAISEAAKQEALATIEERSAFIAELSADIKQLQTNQRDVVLLVSQKHKEPSLTLL
jgi:hypothetical protein